MLSQGATMLNAGSKLVAATGKLDDAAMQTTLTGIAANQDEAKLVNDLLPKGQQLGLDKADDLKKINSILSDEVGKTIASLEKMTVGDLKTIIDSPTTVSL